MKQHQDTGYLIVRARQRAVVSRSVAEARPQIRLLTILGDVTSIFCLASVFDFVPATKLYIWYLSRAQNIA